MSEHNTAIRMAQKLLRMQSERFGEVEVGYHRFEEDPRAGAYRRAANELEALILDDET